MSRALRKKQWVHSASFAAAAPRHGSPSPQHSAAKKQEIIIAPQAQLFETAKDRVGPEALFKQVVNERHPDHVLSLDAQ